LNAVDQRAVRGQRLSKHQSALNLVESSQIGECAADIYCDPKTAFGPRLFSGCHNSHPCVQGMSCESFTLIQDPA
jgi:hypothetical protein